LIHHKVFPDPPPGHSRESGNLRYLDVRRKTEVPASAGMTRWVSIIRRVGIVWRARSRIAPSVDLILSPSKDEVVAPSAGPDLVAKQAHHEANWNEFYANCTDSWLYDRRTHTHRSSPSALS